jgi:hypothetical protein
MMKKEKLIQLSGKHNNKFAKIDADDYARVSSYSWNFHNGYTSAMIDGKTMYMHRLIANTPANLLTDHINHDKLDNRKANLRVCDAFVNMQNMHKPIRGCIKRQVIRGNTYWYGEIRKYHIRYITTTFENEEQAKGGLKQMIKDKKL